MSGSVEAVSRQGTSRGDLPFGWSASLRTLINHAVMAATYQEERDAVLRIDHG